MSPLSLAGPPAPRAADRDILYNAAGVRVCGAKNRSGGRCMITQLKPNGRCRLHGGATPSGPAAGSYRHGRYSRVLPVALAARYQEARSDPDLLALGDEIALLDARLADLIARVASGDSDDFRQRLTSAWKSVLRSQDDPEAQAAALAALGRAIDGEPADGPIWTEIGRLVDQRARLTQAEQARRVAMAQMLDVSEFMALASAIVEIIRSRVHDRHVLAEIIDDIRRLVSRSDSRPAGGTVGG